MNCVNFTKQQIEVIAKVINSMKDEFVTVSIDSMIPINKVRHDFSSSYWNSILPFIERKGGIAITEHGGVKMIQVCESAISMFREEDLIGKGCNEKKGKSDNLICCSSCGVSTCGSFFNVNSEVICETCAEEETLGMDLCFLCEAEFTEDTHVFKDGNGEVREICEECHLKREEIGNELDESGFLEIPDFFELSDQEFEHEKDGFQEIVFEENEIVFPEGLPKSLESLYLSATEEQRKDLEYIVLNQKKTTQRKKSEAQRKAGCTAFEAFIVFLFKGNMTLEEMIQRWGELSGNEGKRTTFATYLSDVRRGVYVSKAYKGIEVDVQKDGEGRYSAVVPTGTRYASKLKDLDVKAILGI